MSPCYFKHVPRLTLHSDLPEGIQAKSKMFFQGSVKYHISNGKVVCYTNKSKKHHVTHHVKHHVRLQLNIEF